MERAAPSQRADMRLQLRDACKVPTKGVAHRGAWFGEVPAPTLRGVFMPTVNAELQSCGSAGTDGQGLRGLSLNKAPF